MQYFYSFLLCLLATTQVTGVAPEAAISLTVEYSDAPLGLDAARPVRVSWKIAASPSTRGVLQNRYRTSVAAWPAPADGSGWRYAPWMTSNRSQLVPLDGFTPAAGSLYTVQVEVDTGGPTTGTAQAVLGTVPDLSTASFIGAADLGLESCPWMRKSFSLSDWAAPDRAVVHIASYGYHDLFVNGKPVGKDVLSPSVSDLGKRVLVRSYDVSAYLSSGNNTLGLWLGAGWAQFSTVNPAKADFFNTTKAPLALAVLQFHPHASAAAGAAFPPDIVTDATWKVKPSSVTHLGRWQNSDFGGDRFDQALDLPDWASPSLPDGSWDPATVYSLPGRVLSPDPAEPNRKREQVPAKTVSHHKTARGEAVYVVEMDRVFSGWLEVTGLHGTPGATAHINLSSVPFCDDSDWDRCQAPGGFAAEYNMRHEIVFGPSGVADFIPRFSYNEVRFAAFSGISKPPAGVVGHRVGNIGVLSGDGGDDATDGGRARIGWFTSSNADLNRIYNTSMRTMANLVTGGMSVDCPHRERLGYLGDAHTTLETALDNVASARFYTKWILDILDIQGYPAHSVGAKDPEGYIAHTAPTVDGGGGPGWSGFVVTMPWELYLRTGDTDVLALAFPGQVKLMDFWFANFQAGLLEKWGSDGWAFLGDWLTPHGSEPSTTPEAELFNNCYVLYCTRLMAKVSLVLGNRTAAARFTARSAAHAKAIHAKFYNASTHGYLDNRQTHLVMPLVAGAVPEALRPAVRKALETEILVHQAGHLDTGLHGTYFLFKFLTDTASGFGGDVALALALVTAKGHPGYLDVLAHNYTAWPEAWGSCSDKAGAPTFPTPFTCEAWSTGSKSPLHGTLNGVGQLFVTGLGGIRRPEGGVGRQQIEFAAPFTASTVLLTSAEARLDGEYGRIASSWATLPGGGGFEHNVTVPPNSWATLVIPAASVASITESGLPCLGAPGITSVTVAGGVATVTLLSGDFAFRASA